MRKIVCMIIALMLCASLTVPAFAATGFTSSVGGSTAPGVVEVPGTGSGSGYTPKPAAKNEFEVVEVEAEVQDDVKVVAITTELGSDEVTSHVYEDCLLITSVAEANKKNDTLEQVDKEAHDLLLDVYKKLATGKLEIPYEDFDLDPDKMSIRELFDATWLCEGKSVEELKDHPENKDHDAILEPENAVMHITFKLGVSKTDKIHVFTYVPVEDGEEGEMEWIEIVEVENNGDGTVTCTLENAGLIAICIEQ